VIDAVVAVDPTAALYASHPYWASALCRSLAAKPNGSARVWRVTASYSSAPFEAKGDGSGTGANSTSPDVGQSNQTPADQRPPTISISRKEVSKVLEKDAVTGDRIVNTVGDPFDPLPEIFRSRHLITWKFHRTPVQLDWAARSSWHDTINSLAVNILGKNYPAFSLRCTDYSLDTVWETGPAGLAFFFALTVVAEFDPDTWKVKILNTGKRKWVGSMGDPTNPRKPQTIVDSAGQPVADPVPLTAAGDPVSVDGAPPFPYHYVEPDGYVPLDWLGGGGSLTGANAILA
jgi:hypothetical protein